VPVISGPPTLTFAGSTEYNSTASLNNQSGLGDSQGPNKTLKTSNSPVPIWGDDLQEGDIAPESSTAGDVGDSFKIEQDVIGPPSNAPLGISALSQYGAATATFGNATDFFSQLSYAATGPGSVTLSPTANPFGSGYWTNIQGGSLTSPSRYIGNDFSTSNIGILPGLVINITVPEPMSLGILAIGGLGLLGRRNRRGI
jgi:hypothetical protein